MAILGIDVGGTFTDAVLIHEDGSVDTAKVPTAERHEESVVTAARAVGAHDVTRFAHGTTAATNALLERRGARTAFVTTAGFEHLLHLRRQNRAHLYRLCAAHPEPLVPLERCHGVTERAGPEGVIAELDLATLPAVDADAIAVCLLFSFRHPGHEQAVAEELRRRYPAAHVVASHELAPEFREYERASTTVVDAYLGPLVASSLGALQQAAVGAGLPDPLVMTSSGGLLPLAEAVAHAARVVLSGPAAGVVGAARVAAAAGFEAAISFDMGGTSTDVALISAGEAGRSAARDVAGVPLRLPTVDVHTVGAGGGSIARRDAAGALHVGPRSAGSHPGPACYELVADAATEALRDIDPADVIAVVNAEMERALRVVTVERGHDPRDLALVAFGGAGPLHACALAEELEVPAVLVPRAAGVLSALGLAAGDVRRERVRSHVVPLADAGELPAEGEVDLRYRGQSFELTVPLGPDVPAAFHAAHEERYGYADPEREIELVAVRTAEVGPGPPVELTGGAHVSAAGPHLVELEGATCWVPAGWSGETDDHGTLVLRR